MSLERSLREVDGLKLALLQLPSRDSDTESNIELLKMMLRNVKADFYLTPEMFLTGFEIGEGNFTINGIWSEIRELSKGKAIGVGGLLEENGKLYNAYIIFKDKEVVHVRKKLMLFDLMNERDLFSVGNPPSVFELWDFKFSVIICYEVRFPELLYEPFRQGVEVILVPAAWPRSRVKVWKALVKARGYENLAYSIGINRWGEGKYGPFGGHSVVATPSGEAIELGEGIGILTIELSKDEISRAREFPSYKDRIALQTKINILPKGT
ncbi:hypothetical protein EYM_07010 [Ignicoccus islandicus DSM 13165]|uniref:CN hydrolase domain-containing protein n=1 Tax=Ignicoccus islandicus DSM 13165 TaxID=940295 RepID=A0A0U3FAN5_9CREN|nr:nitrilase-related carbon-nitrogen hydrolase [Ignicoccus islandicus]ALU12745.1 hypothetical protein EYM_07010 [Ignicoccus islandicus DSM 13165]